MSGEASAAQMVSGGADGPITWRDELGLNGWDLVVLAATLIVAITTPLSLVFDYAENGWWILADVALSVPLAIDVRRRFTRPVRLAGRLLTDPVELRRRYLRSWFVIDVLAAIPFSALAAVPVLAGVPETVVKVLALTRLLRMGRLLALQGRWRAHTSLNPAVLRLSFLVLWIAVLSHWIACGWIALDGDLQGHPELHPYQQALYWTITTLTTVGYGDLVPEGSPQVGYTMVVMALGAAIYGYAIGNVANLLTNIDLLRSQHLGRIETVSSFLRDRQVPRHLQAQVRNYYNYIWESRMGDQTELLEDLPESLRVEIALHLNRHIFAKVPLFAGAGEALIQQLALNLQPSVAIPGEPVVRVGEPGHRMYFINKGSVDVLAADGSSVVATLADGAFFGEFALLTSEPRANTVVAREYCNLYSLDRDSFDRVLVDFPNFATEVRRIAAQRRAGD
ncbi:MAG: cyclic nucleotide-binding domain-containing protein [Acidimicrobiia bacterium]|nr:cyclic nucleotide-binding domain-containing protein [Acidimicrobiia bacterium]